MRLMMNMNLAGSAFNYVNSKADTATGENAAWGSVSPGEVVNDWNNSTIEEEETPLRSSPVKPGGTRIGKLTMAPILASSKAEDKTTKLDDGTWVFIEDEDTPL